MIKNKKLYLIFFKKEKAKTKEREREKYLNEDNNWKKVKKL